MSSSAHTISLMAAIALAYLWLQVPALRDHSLQIFAVMMVGFFVIKRIRKAKLWHIAPDRESWELSIITFSFLLLIGATGNTESIFYPLGFLHLFFIVLASTVPTAIGATAGIMLFHYAIEQSFTFSDLQTMISLPIMLVLFIFTKHQYDQSQFKQNLLKEENKAINALTADNHADLAQLSDFIHHFLPSKITILRQLIAQSPQRDEFENELRVIEEESQDVFNQISAPRQTGQQTVSDKSQPVAPTNPTSSKHTTNSLADQPKNMIASQTGTKKVDHLDQQPIDQAKDENS